MNVESRPSGLLVARDPLPAVPLLKHRKVTRTVTLSDGRRAKITKEDGGVVFHIEHGEGIDAVAMPKTVKVFERHAAPEVRVT